MPAKLDLRGQRFGRLKVIKDTGQKQGGSYMWRCKCDCGITVDVVVKSLRNGNTTSCGCQRRESCANRLLTHGCEGTRLYVVWTLIKNRCYNTAAPNYHRYGGRGITMHRQWRKDFISFAEYVMGLPKSPSRKFLLSPAHGKRGKLSIDRTNNDKGYRPGNLRWATQKEQVRNSTAMRHKT